MDIKFKDSERILPSERYRKGFVEKVPSMLNSFLLSRKICWKGPSPHRKYSPVGKTANKKIVISEWSVPGKGKEFSKIKK